jgi:hypothetical protein
MDFDSKRLHHKLSSLSFNQNNDETFHRNRFSEKYTQQKIEKPQENLREIEYAWKQTETLNSVPPNDYTVTHINQNHELMV